VLRAVKYGETSLVVTIFTEEFGIQSYLVNGVRSTRSARIKAASFQPGMMLDMVVYHHVRKSLQRIAEVQYGYLYQRIPFDPVRTAIMLYIVELLLRVLQHPQAFKDLYAFSEQQLRWLDRTDSGIANLPLFFTLRVAALLGIGLPRGFSAATPYLDLREGIFLSHVPVHPDYLDAAASEITDRLLSCQTAEDAATLRLQQTERRKLLLHYQDYLRWHIPGFTALQVLPTLFQLFDTSDS